MKSALTLSSSFTYVQPDTTGKMRRVAVASSLGNALEIYDFTVYSFFAVIIGQLFFPADSSLASLMMSLSTFAMGFLIRPLGAVLIGRFADRYGRKQALSLTIALMTIGTGIIALTPTYSSIGGFAMALLILGRLLQGFSAGGEVGAASAFLMESGRTDNRCFMVCWQGASQGAAALLGALSGLVLTTILSEQALHSWGWRVPFIIGLFIGPVGWYIRKYLDETHEHREKPRLFRHFVRTHARTLGLGILIMASSTVTFYMTVFYMPTYLIRTLHYPSGVAFFLVVFACILLIVIPPLASRFADRLPRRKPLLYWSCGLQAVLAYPAFMLLDQQSTLLSLVAVSILMAPVAVSSGPGLTLLMEAFSRNERVTGVSIIYSFGVTVFGGFSPLVVTWLIAETGSPLVPAWYLCGAIVASGVALRLYPEQPGRA
ncbi:Proline/betaine transporter [Pseudomonas fluorescens]|uniref:Proline/betaine transporter n=1 Tax=Pseudomonas fluorescens TaxID=294 RepID=A0A5E7QIC5_PSEFL|nr:MFS transporter [Pseudomonas fluorescens]VVP62012.1 Proline/betaine transporter [Pseudomonas fluorescens]